MKSALLFAITLLCAAQQAQAELVKVFENIRGTEVYIDTDTMAGGGRYRKVWELQTFREPSPQGMLSMRIHKEYDCKDEAARMLSYVVFKGKMGTGEKMGTVATPGAWQSVSKNPGAKGGFRMVCGK